MAALIKLRHMPVMQRCLWNHFNSTSRKIATSKKNSDSASAVAETNEDKNWVSYGFHYQDKEEDTNAHHASFFFSITLCIVFGGFAWAYAPDVHMRDWAHREAFLELRRRSQANLPLIDPNYVDPASVVLPDDTELCESGIEIVI